MTRWRILPALYLVFTLAVNSCTNQSGIKSDATATLFPEGAGVFRGFALGMNLDSIRQKETAVLRMEDECGLVFSDSLGPTIHATYSYFNPCPPQTSVRLLSGIISVFKADEEFDAADFLTALEERLRQQYGVAEGGFGAWEWPGSPGAPVIRLNLGADRKTITLNVFLP